MGARGAIHKESSVTRHKPVAVQVFDRPRRVPKVPVELTPSSKRWWRKLWNSGVAKAWDEVADNGLVTRLFEVYAEIDRLVIYHSLEVQAELRKLRKEALEMEVQLGLTPMARARLGLVIGEAKLTAHELNRRLASGSESRAVEVWEGEWGEA